MPLKHDSSRHAPLILYRTLYRYSSLLSVGARVRLVALAFVVLVILRRVRGRLAWPLSSVLCKLGIAPSPPVVPINSATLPSWERRSKQADNLGLSAAFRYGVGQSNRSPCRSFAAGCCNYGAECYYSHADAGGWSGARDVSKKPHMCSFFALGIRECRSSCRNAHGFEELSERLPVPSPPGFPDEGLPYYDSHCHLDGILLMRRFGYDWPFKAKLCRDYMERECKWGRCAYAHGEHELRKRPAIQRADLSDLIKGFPPGFSGFVHTCCDEESIEQAVTLVQWGRELSGGAVYVSFGLHPSDYFRYTDSLERLFLDAIERCGDRAVAWGECGLDYYRKPTDEDKVEMSAVFVRQIELAVRRGLPLVVHSREAEEDVLSVLRDHLPRNHLVCLHSFQGSTSTLASFLREWPHAYFGINGVATYATAHSIADLVRVMPLDRLLLETDGPFMIPDPYRYNGGGSHAGHIPRIAEHVAKLKGVALEVVLAHSNANLCAMYGIKPHRS